MGKTNKSIKHTRKVILLKYNDRKETLILSKTVKRTEKKLIIKVEYNTKIKKQAIDTESNVKHPLLQSQLKDRIVPCCCRSKCCRKQKLKNPIKKENYKKKREYKNKQTLRKREMSLSSISSISDDLNNNSVYENISSDDISFSTDDEIESLLKSTRKRMKDLDDNWNFLQRGTSNLVSKQMDKFNSSINSLDTLILVEDETKDTELYDICDDVYSPTINTEQKLKYEYIEANNNDTNFNHDFMDEQTLHDNKIDVMVSKFENDSNNFQNFKINNICIKQELYDNV